MGEIDGTLSDCHLISFCRLLQFSLSSTMPFESERRYTQDLIEHSFS